MTPTAEVTATASLTDGTRPRCRSALSTGKATLAIPTYLAAIADALEGLSLPPAGGAWVGACTNLL
jgi:hypothetical protein